VGVGIPVLGLDMFALNFIEAEGCEAEANDDLAE
jgi:hypothetical protein